MHSPAMRLLPLLTLAALLGACATSTPTRQAPVETRADAPQPSPLAGEQRWLAQWFEGTPVQIGAQDDGALRVAVPLRHSFDAGQTRVKPALGAVLDKVAQSLRRHSTAKVEVAAPPDPGGALASERSASLRDYLVSKGVRGARIERVALRPRDVELRLLPGPQAIDRLEDTPPAPGTPIKPVKAVRPPAGR